MMTEADVQHHKAAPGQRKSKRERRREYARRVGEQACDGCRHARMDHTPIRNDTATFCHMCMDKCTTK